MGIYLDTFIIFDNKIFSSANPLLTRTLTQSKVLERSTLSAHCGALSLWPLAIALDYMGTPPLW